RTMALVIFSSFLSHRWAVCASRYTTVVVPGRCWRQTEVARTSDDVMSAGAAHRPWPVPPGPWALAMQWHGLLFMHWPVQPAALRPLIPPPLEIDTFDRAAWIGVTPFHMMGVRPHYVPALPWVS